MTKAHPLSRGLLLLLTLLLLGCQAVDAAAPPNLPTLAAAAGLPEPTIGVPATFTAVGETAVSPTPISFTPRPSVTPSPTRIIPTLTPFTPRPSATPTPTYSPIITPTETPVIKPINQYAFHEVIPYQAFPTPPGDNGWGMHWIPTVKQDRGVVDRFVAEMVRMNIKWVVFLNDGANIGDNDYLVDKLVANGIMPVMRLYRSGVLPYSGDVGAMVRHYRAKGVYYYQLYNEPNVNDENHQGFANPTQYALAWASAARIIVANGGLPGIGAFSPGGAYNHYEFLDRTLRALEFNGDGHLLNHAWLSVHNYHGTRPYDDPDGFLLFRKYDEIVRSHLGRSMAMVGTEGGSYSDNPAVVIDLLAYQYNYMRDAEPYFLAFSYWLIANEVGGSFDPAWEWQSLFRANYVHPVVTEYFYRNGR